MSEQANWLCTDGLDVLALMDYLWHRFSLPGGVERRRHHRPRHRHPPPRAPAETGRLWGELYPVRRPRGYWGKRALQRLY